MRPSSLAGVTALILLASAACSNDNTGPNGTGTVTLQLATLGTGATTASNASSPASLTVGADVIVINSVQLVARKLKLEQSGGNCPAEDPDETSNEVEDDEDCPSLRLGPMLLSPPLTAGAVSEFSLDLPAGTYNTLQLQIHRPVDHNADAAFLAANPGFDGISIKVTGTFNGAPFTFTTGLTAVVDVNLESPVVLPADGTANITLLLDVGAWFLANGGLSLINPLTLTLQQTQQVDQNIRASFHAFEDADHDGIED